VGIREKMTPLLFEGRTVVEREGRKRLRVPKIGCQKRKEEISVLLLGGSVAELCGRGGEWGGGSDVSETNRPDEERGRVILQLLEGGKGFRREKKKKGEGRWLSDLLHRVCEEKAVHIMRGKRSDDCPNFRRRK